MPWWPSFFYFTFFEKTTNIRVFHFLFKSSDKAKHQTNDGINQMRLNQRGL